MQEKNIIELADDLKGKIKTWGGLTVDIVDGLYIARDLYNGKGNNQYSIVQNCTIHSFVDFLIYIELPRRTAYSWLEKYSPEEKKLLTDEEFDKKKRDENEQKRKEFEKQSSRINEFKKTGEKPNGWNESTDAYRLKKEQEDAEYVERKRKAFEEREKKFQEKKHIHDIDTEQLLNAAAKLTGAFKEKERILSKMRLTGNNSKEPIYDALFEYLCSLNENQRLEACHNIIKFCKGIAAECQKKSVE